MKAGTKAPVSRRALIQRLNRKLEKDGMTVKKTSGKRAKIDLGEYFVLDLKRNSAVELHVDLEKLGHKHGVLAEWERMED
jgi:hypothetical protein